MEIDLYAKKIGKGHVKIGSVNVPDNFGYEYRMPVRSEVVAFQNLDPLMTPSAAVSNYRVFRYKPSTLTHLLKTKRMYLEE